LPILTDKLFEICELNYECSNFLFFHFQLELKPGKVSIRGILCIAKLKKLVLFRFCAESTNEDDWHDFIPLVVKNMPWLESIVDDENDFSDFERRPVTRMPNNLDVQGVFQLREMHATETLPLQASFPNLYSVYFRGPLTNFKSLEIFESFDTLCVLSLENVPFSQMSQILKVVGQRLEQLMIFYAADPIDLVNLFNLCPNLQVFYIDHYSACVSPDWSTLSSHNFRRLYYFSMDYRSDNISSELLEFVFKAPLIQQIRFHKLTLRPGDLQMIKDLNESHLQRLIAVTIYQINYDGPNAEGNIATFVKFIVCKGKILPGIEKICNTGKGLCEWQRKDLAYFYKLFFHIH
jgi:hypothetical protein